MKQSITIPTSINELLGFSINCSCGRKHEVDTKFIAIERGALSKVIDFVAELGKNFNICVVADKTTNEIAGNNVCNLLLKNNHTVKKCIVPNAEGNRPHATSSNVLLVENQLEGVDVAISVGSGTINDLTKLASFNKNIPYISVATAPSMNGYTSAIAAIIQNGLKKTVNCHQPYAVVADLDILSQAPHHLIASGFGDLESKPSSTADFLLSGILRNSYYCPVPQQVVFAAEKKAADYAAGLAVKNFEAIEALTEALILSGISMKLAGSSSPASGGEHLISHYWDMTSAQEHRVEGWHGAQVGVATIVTSTLYEKLKNINPEQIDINSILKARISDENLKNQLLKRHGAWANDAIKEYFNKHLSIDAHKNELENIVTNWKTIWRKLDNITRSGSIVRSLLKAANAPINVAQIGLTPAHLQNSFLFAREIRGRFTILDFAAQLGLLEKLREEVLASSGCIDS